MASSGIRGSGSGLSGRSQFRTEVDVTGAAETAAQMRQIGNRAWNTLPIMEVLKEDLFEMSRARVQSAPWVPLKDVTVSRKIATEEDPSILRDEWRPIKGRSTRVGNKLYLALTLDGATGQVKRATRTRAMFGVKSAGNQELFYARFVQNVKGTRRQILALTAGDAMTLTLKVAAWVRFGEGAGQSGYLSGSFKTK